MTDPSTDQSTKAKTSWPPLRVLIFRLLDRMMARKWFTLMVAVGLALVVWSMGFHTYLIETLQAIPGLGALIGGLGG